ncbi:DUF262 domain-containing protein [Corynebacterium amycolatum]|uniref:DUF262 domain-containing protein n=2 Tax=Corynebacterium TaxID=1716 RepID=UPI00254F62A4|nr:DUF262 domain-containing protein [Corynebacterium amycolatum]MDK7146235.1 DUF262 domain-containing protein [Corynebacterium amycolatum]
MSIRELIQCIDRGEIRVPAFQRGFVWTPELMAHLLDSIYKKYPIGSVILWRTREGLNTERKLGPFELTKAEDGFPIKYVLDGQQRITTIYSTFKTPIPDSVQDSGSWTRIYFNLSAEESPQNSMFTAFSSDDEVDGNEYFPVDSFFESVDYRKATENLSDEQKVKIDKVQEVFKEAKIPVQEISTENRGEVAIVFERVNRLGVELDTLQLLSAWTWSEDFELVNKFDSLSDEFSDFGFAEISKDKKLLLQCFSALINKNSNPESLMSLDGAEVRDSFEKVEYGLKGAIDFLKNNLFVADVSHLPYSLVLVPLCVFFAEEPGTQVNLTNHQRETILRWLWRSFFGQRYNNQPQRNLNKDITEMVKLKKGEKSELDQIGNPVLAEFYSEKNLRMDTVRSKVFVLQLLQAKPRSFISGEPVSRELKLAAFNREQLHHLMPKAFLRREFGTSQAKASPLANFALISAADNNKIKSAAPSKYKDKIAPEMLDKILDSAIVPHSLFDDNFERFIEDRSSRLADNANKLMGFDSESDEA